MKYEAKTMCLIRKERKELQVFNLNEKLKDYKQRWEEHLERMSDSRPVSYTHLDVYKRQGICFCNLEKSFSYEFRSID